MELYNITSFTDIKLYILFAKPYIEISKQYLSDFVDVQTARANRRNIVAQKRQKKLQPQPTIPTTNTKRIGRLCTASVFFSNSIFYWWYKYFAHNLIYKIGEAPKRKRQQTKPPTVKEIGEPLHIKKN